MKTLNFMPHQSDVLEKTKQLNRVAYFLDMGLGKTFVGSEKMKNLGSRVNLLICQKSKIDDWVQHFTDYYGMAVFDLTASTKEAKRKNEAILLNIKHGTNIPCVLVINYELAFRRSYLLDMSNFTLMLDESSLISNENAKRSRFVLKMHPDNVILLSGTPTAGKYEKLWSQCKLLGWEISKKAFWNSYVETKWIDVGCFRQEIVTGYKNVNHLKKQLSKHGAIFMKTEEVMTLPEQVVQNITLKPTKEYRQFRKNSYLMLKDGTELVGDNTLTKILYSRQLCGHYHKDKLQAFSDLVQSTEDRLIVFYNFTAELEQLKRIADELERPHSEVNGQKRDLSSYDDCENSVTFIQYQAGAMGGNYQKANKVIYFSLPLGKGSCDLWEQSKKRIHRIGQSRTCFYYYLLVRDSIEEWNLAALKEGRDYTNDLFDNR